jgi:hypothetical protein
MPMPREDDDDLFHSEADVDFDDDSETEKPKKKTAKRKVAKKKTAAPKKAAPSKGTKKKVKRATVKEPVEEVEETLAEQDDTPTPPRRVKKKAMPAAEKDFAVKPSRKKKAAAKPAPKSGKPAGFGAGLFDNSDDQSDAPQGAAVEDESKIFAAQPEDAVDAEKSHKTTDEPLKTADEKVDEYGRPEPPANYVVHVYELGRFKRTIVRDFTAEAAEAFATEFSRTSKRYGRKAIAGKKDTQPAKELA